MNAPATFTGGGDGVNSISTHVGIPVGKPPSHFRQLRTFEIDAYIHHTGNHPSGVSLSVGLHKKPQTEKNLSLYDIGWTSSKRVFPSGDIEKVVFSGVIPDNLLSLDGIDSFSDDFAEHEI